MKTGPTKPVFSGELPDYPNVIDGNLMDGQGSIGHRARKLMKLQRLGVVDKKFDFVKLMSEPKAFDVVEHTALTEARTKATGKGFLLRHVEGTDSRLQTITYEGDPDVCWREFKAPGFIGKINTDVGTHEETVRIKDGEQVVVLRPDGKIVRLDGSEIHNGGSEGRKDASEFQKDIAETVNGPLIWSN